MDTGKSKLYWPPAVTVDAVIFTIQENDLKVLLIERTNEPFKKYRALPGGFLGKNEPSENAIERILKDKTGVKGVYTEQLYTFDNLNRDPRGHILTVETSEKVRIPFRLSGKEQTDRIAHSFNVGLVTLM